MNILITGGGGFLGWHLKKEMNKCGVSFTAPTSKELNLLDINSTVLYLSKHKFDCILHAAALCGGILRNKNQPADFLYQNTQMGLNIYEAARQTNVSSIYSLGSVCMYPLHTNIPFSEDDIWKNYPEPTNAPYGIAKRTLMMLGQTYRQQYGFTGAHFIPVNMYGEHDHFDLINSHVIPALLNKFITAVNDNSPYVECWGSGEATREFLYAEDCAEVLVSAVTSGFDCAEPINLGTGQDISIKDLAIMIKEITGFNGDIVFNGAVSDGQPRRMLDVSRAKKHLGWTAKTTLREGIKKTYEWYKATR